jgi:non-ribosomal peptide synthetase component F
VRAGWPGGLAALGVGPDELVALFLEPSIEVIVGALGVLAAGGAYLPMDSAHPDARVADMLADSGARLVLTEDGLAGRLPAGVEALRIRELDGVAGGGASRVRPDHLAYLIYTSGSTGRPKGTGLSHRGLVNLIHGQRKALPLDAGDRLLQFASPGFRRGGVGDLERALERGSPGHPGARRAPGPGSLRASGRT